MYEETTASVRHQGMLSDTFKCSLGVRQGESISPFLFNIFLNDLDETLAARQFQGVNIGNVNIKTLLYADDLAILAETREDLQVGLDILYDYCNRWKLVINTEKTSIIIFRRGGMVTVNDHFFYGDKTLNVLEKISYLGLTLSSRGKFAQTQSNLSDRGIRAMHKLVSDTH